MASEKASSRTSVDLKKSYMTHTIKFKADVLDRLAMDGSASKVAREFGMNESTVRNYKRSEDAIRKAIASPKISNDARSIRPIQHERIEWELVSWIKDNQILGINTSGSMIREKALQLYARICEEDPNYLHNSGEFVASAGWLALFRQRHKDILADTTASAGAVEELQSVDKVEKFHPVDSIDEFHSVNAVDEFRSVLMSVVEQEGYHPEQVFNAAETNLYWKRLPDCTFISHREKEATGFKASQDRVSLLFCANATGDFKLKPMLVYKSESPPALKGAVKTRLPVVWRSNSKACVTAALVEDWATSYAIPVITDYNRKMNLDNRALITVDSSPSHPALLNQLHPTIKFLYLPPETTPFIQPLDQGVIVQFKRHYTKSVLERLAASFGTWKTDVLSSWKYFDIRDAIGLIDRSWKAIESKTINTGWYNVWPNVVVDSKEFPDIDHEVQVMLDVARRIPGTGFQDLSGDEICALLESHQEEPSAEEALQLTEASENEASLGDMKAEPIHLLTAKEIGEFLGKVSCVLYSLEKRDPDLERSSSVVYDIERSLAPYRQLYEQLLREQQQSTIRKFFSPIPHHQEVQDFSASPSFAGALYPAAVNDPDDLEWDLRKYPCMHCNKKFKSKTGFDQHMLTHNNERRYSCEQCGARFNRKDHLQRHWLVHLRDNKYKCENCKKKLPCKIHRFRQMFTQGKKRKFRCRLCSRSFSRLKFLKSHLLKHDEEKVFECSLCGESFFFKRLLREHMAEHGEEKHIPEYYEEQQDNFKKQSLHKQPEGHPGAEQCLEYEEKYSPDHSEGEQQQNIPELPEDENWDAPVTIKSEGVLRIKEEVDPDNWPEDTTGDEWSVEYLPDRFFPVCNIDTMTPPDTEMPFVSTEAAPIAASLMSSISAAASSLVLLPIPRPLPPVSPASSSGSVHLEDTTTRAGRVTRKPLRFRTNFVSYTSGSTSALNSDSDG